MKFKAFLSIVAIVAMSCGSNNNSPESARAKLYDIEKEQPLEYLSIEGNNKRNLFGQTVVRAVVRNKANFCSYENIRIRTLYFNKDGQEVENHEDVIDKPIAPHDQAKFTARYFTPKGTDSVHMQIMSADAVKDTSIHK